MFYLFISFFAFCVILNFCAGGNLKSQRNRSFSLIFTRLVSCLLRFLTTWWDFTFVRTCRDPHKIHHFLVKYQLRAMMSAESKLAFPSVATGVPAALQVCFICVIWKQSIICVTRVYVVSHFPSGCRMGWRYRSTKSDWERRKTNRMRTFPLRMLAPWVVSYIIP